MAGDIDLLVSVQAQSTLRPPVLLPWIENTGNASHFAFAMRYV